MKTGRMATEVKDMYEVVQSKFAIAEWVVEATGEDGEVYVTLFSGPDAESRARDYAGWKNEQPAPVTG